METAKVSKCSNHLYILLNYGTKNIYVPRILFQGGPVIFCLFLVLKRGKCGRLCLFRIINFYLSIYSIKEHVNFTNLFREVSETDIFFSIRLHDSKEINTNTCAHFNLCYIKMTVNVVCLI
jgi:hypothetical protein